MPEFQWLAAAFPNFVRYVVVGFALAGFFLLIYVLITPWREFRLIRAGNTSAAIALVGALLGFSLPLANTIAHSVSLHVVMRLMLPGLRGDIEADKMSAGITAGGFAACFGLINAACLTT